MKQTTKKRLGISAKIVAVLYIILIAMFAFDEKVFSLGFFIHLIPALVFLGCLIFAWFKSRWGGIAFGVAGFGTIIVFNTYRELIPFLAISLVPIMGGILFYFSNEKS